MLEPKNVESLYAYIKRKYPELTDDEINELSTKYLELGKLLLVLWLKQIEKSSKDPPS